MKRIHENEEKLRAALDEREKAILDAIKDDSLAVSSSIDAFTGRSAWERG